MRNKIIMPENSSIVSNEINKDELYRDYTRRVDWQDKLYKTAAHKALDVPEDDMNITSNSGNTVNNTYQQPKGSLGTLAKLALGGALLGTGMGAGVGIPLLLDALKNKEVVSPINKEKDLSIDKTLDIEFEIKNGEIVPLKIKPVEGG